MHNWKHPADVADLATFVIRSISARLGLGKEPKDRDTTEVRLAVLEEELLTLRRSLVEEVRTRRLVVVTEDGFERVVAESAEESGGVRVYCRGGEEGHDARTYVELFAEQEPLSAGLHLTGGGNGHGSLAVWTTEGRSGAEQWPAPFVAVLAVHQPNAAAGAVVDFEGVKAHPQRLFEERENWRRREAKGDGALDRRS